MAVNFNGSTKLTRVMGLGAQSSWTVTCWFKLGSGSSYKTFWSIGAGTVGSPSTSDMNLLQTRSGGSGIEYFDDTTGPNNLGVTTTNGVWYFVGFSCSGSNAIWRARAEGAGSFQSGSLSGLDSSVVQNILLVGDSHWGSEFLNGSLEAFKWWSTNLSGAELEAEYATRVPVRSANVRCYYKWTSSATQDDSGNGQTLSTSGSPTIGAGPASLVDEIITATALNAIYNPSFETDTSGWRGSGTNFSIDRSTTVGGKDGSAALRIVGGSSSTTVYNPSTDISGSSATGQREIAAGTAIKVSFWLYVPAAQISNVSAIGVAGTNEGFTDAISFQFVSPVGGGPVVADTWQQYEAVATVIGGTTLKSTQIQIWTNADVANGVVLAYIDAVSINDRLATDTYTDTEGLQDTVAPVKTITKTFDDTVALSDTTTKSVQLDRTDSAGLTDSSTQVNTPPGPNPTDTLGLSDTVTRSLQKIQTDDAGLDDDWAIVSTFDRPVTDGVGLSDGIGLAATYNRGIQDSAGLGDTATSAATFNRAVSESTGLTDDATRSFERPVEDLLGLSDEATRVLHKIVDDSVDLRDDVDDQVNYNRFTDESVGLADDHESVATFNRSFAESVALTDDVSFGYGKLDDDYLPIVDTFTTVTTFSRTGSDTEGLSDSYVIALAYTRSPTDSVGLTDNLTRQLSRLVQDDTGLTDEVELDLYRLEVIRTDSVGLTDQFTVVRTRTFTKTDDTELDDEVILSMVSQRSQVDDVELADQAVVSLASSRSVADSAGLTDSALVTLTHNRVITDSLALTDSFTAPVVFNRPITDSVGLRDYPSRPDVTFSRTFSDNAGSTDYISVTRRLTFTDSLPLADNVTQARSWNRVFTDQLGITDQFTRFASYTRSITDSVGLQDLPSVKVPTQEDWDFNFGNLKKAWGFTQPVKSWEFGDLEKAWRMTMAEQIVEVAAISAEDIEVTVSAREAGVDIDPRVDPVHFAFLTPGTSPSGGTTWVAGDWGVQDQPGDLPDLYLAIGTVSGLAAGRYDIWCRVTHGAKTPMDKVGTLIVK